MNRIKREALETISGINFLNSISSPRDDIEEFDRAFKNNDIPSLIKLCNSNQPVSKK